MKFSSQSLFALCLLSPLLFIEGNDDVKERVLKRVEVVSHSNNPSNLGNCQGDCDRDSQCQIGYYCFQRNSFQSVPGCSGGKQDGSLTDYCVARDTVAPKIGLPELEFYGANPSRRPLGKCEGDCDTDRDCESHLICYQRNANMPIPGCSGNDGSNSDFCTDGSQPLPQQDSNTYRPGKLTIRKLGLLLSEGLDVRLIAESGQKVKYHDGSRSGDRFHDLPDAGATFPDPRENNPGGWIYVSNAEVRDNRGGVGAITFDAHGNIINYKRILRNTNMNCGGGRTPWNTWVSCEEVVDRGKLYQVDPTGKRSPQKLTLGNDGGAFESFAYDIRNRDRPCFFVTEDWSRGPLRRFIPNNPNWSDPWNMLHGSGETNYLVLMPSGNDRKGTFRWTSDRGTGRNNARKNYPNAEGIDVKGNKLYFICKNIKKLFILNLDDMTYVRKSTVNGLFDGTPDQVERILEGSSELLYFTEEGGRDAGVHARDQNGSFYTIFESPVYSDETTGLSWSPDGKIMFVAYQRNGKLFAIFRRDGRTFHQSQVQLKSHQSGDGWWY